MRPEHRRFVVGCALAYAGLACAWIYGSGWLLIVLVSDPARREHYEIVKGFGFVAVTAILLAGLLARGMRRLDREMCAQRAAQEAMKRWADAFAHCAQGVALVGGEDERITATNRAFAAMLGEGEEELTGRSLLELYASDGRDQVKQAFLEADRRGSAQCEADMPRNDGSSVRALVDIVSVKASGGLVTYRVITAQDVTERRREEELKRHSQEQLLAVVNSLTEGLVIFTPQGELVLMNQAFRAMHGVPPGTMTDAIATEYGKLFQLSTLDGRKLAREERPLPRILRGEKLRDLELVIERIGTAWRRVFSYGGAIITDATGGAHALVTVTDVTERREAFAAALESEDRFRSVVESIDEVFWMRDLAEDRIVYVSPAFETIWGRPTTDFLGQRCEVWLSSIHAADREEIRALVGVEFPDDGFERQYRIVRPDGSERWVRDQAYPVRDASGRVTRCVGVAQDITERMQLEAQFLRAQRLEAVGTLAGGIAHDLNNILAPTLMAAGLLKERVTDDVDRDMLTMVERSARRGADIIRQLLTFSRGVDGVRAPLQLRHVVKEISTIIRETFPRDISFIESLAEDLWLVVADATQIHQVLVNLAVNARDAMPHGGRLVISAANVSVGSDDPLVARGTVPGPHVRLSVQDSGMGMSPETVMRIFEPFFTTKPPGKGTGLGLATVLGIVRSHGGVVTVDSAVGEGSTFHVFLPAAQMQEDHTVVAEEERLPVGRGELILVVDDEEAIREATRHVLEKQNYRVITASDGKAAIESYLTHRDNIRLMVTDLMMPEMSGPALVRALRLLDPRLRVIATTGLDREETRGEMLALGIVDLLPKPCGPKALLDAIRFGLDSSE